MAKFPNPPGVEALKAIPPAICRVASGTKVIRVFRSRGRHPVHWNSFRYHGPTSARFDHHLCDQDGEPCEGERGILYGAIGSEATPTCLAEVYQDARTIDRNDQAPVLCAFSLTKPLVVLDLTGAFTTRIGASMAINSGSRVRSRRWAAQMYEAYPNIHGILYSSSMHGNHWAMALFERAAFALPKHPDLHRQLNDPSLDDVLIATAESIGYMLTDLD